MKPSLTFNELALPLILAAFGKSIEDGIIMDSKSGEPVLTPEGDLIEAKDFGGIKKGSEIFIKDDICSVLNIVEGTY